jgi:hypothetical protein
MQLHPPADLAIHEPLPDADNAAPVRHFDQPVAPVGVGLYGRSWLMAFQTAFRVTPSFRASHSPDTGASACVSAARTSLIVDIKHPPCAVAYYYAIISQEMAANLQESGAQVYGVDTEVRYEPTVPLFSVTEGWTGFVDALEDGCEKGIVFKGDTAEELARAMGVDEKMLAETISDYNACCEEGMDALLGKDPKYLTSLGDKGYYAVKARPMSLGAIGGVLVNSNLQVIKEDGTVITGLFSAGNDVAEFYNNSYPLIEGISLGSAFNGGRMIGEQAAELAKSK